ncbi:MAG: hypothetical protein KF836_13305 [Fimbriimonadaceae bacterium]|nr:hypothetical protein [Fimbriimonadaceae bacterium]
MKKEIHPGVIAAVLVLLVGGVIAFFVMSGSPSTEKVDLKTLDPKSLEDPEPIKRGQPGYKERTTDPD